MQAADPDLGFFWAQVLVGHDRLELDEGLGNLLLQFSDHLEDLLNVFRQAAFLDITVTPFGGGGFVQAGARQRHFDALPDHWLCN